MFQFKLLHHVHFDHRFDLKLAHATYKCKACPASFLCYRLFEAHVYSVHSVSSSSSSRPITNGGAPHRAFTTVTPSAASHESVSLPVHVVSKSVQLQTVAKPQANAGVGVSKMATGVAKVENRTVDASAKVKNVFQEKPARKQAVTKQIITVSLDDDDEEDPLGTSSPEPKKARLNES
jgi:uncharacterized protein (UPF0179 family)